MNNISEGSCVSQGGISIVEEKNEISIYSYPRGDVGVEYVLSTPLRVVRGD